VLGVAAAAACEACMELTAEVCVGETGLGFVLLLVVVESKSPLLLDVEMGEVAGRDLTDDAAPMAESGDASPLVSGFAIFNGPRDKSMTGLARCETDVSNKAKLALSYDVRYKVRSVQVLRLTSESAGDRYLRLAISAALSLDQCMRD
jgi:hypothetical protein